MLKFQSRLTIKPTDVLIIQPPWLKLEGTTGTCFVIRFSRKKWLLNATINSAVEDNFNAFGRVTTVKHLFL